MPPSATAGREQQRKLSEELARIGAMFSERAVPLREVIAVLQDRAYLLLIVLLCLPFVAPVSIPGLSTPLGAVIALIAASFALGRQPWLPKRLLDWHLPAGFFGTVIRVAHKVVAWMEKFLQPRAPGLTAAPWLRRVHALVLVASALLLLLPLPIPLTNTFPAWAILLTAGGLLERDGLFIVLGYVALAAAVAYFLLIGVSIEQSLHWISHWLSS